MRSNYIIMKYGKQQQRRHVSLATVTVLGPVTFHQCASVKQKNWMFWKDFPCEEVKVRRKCRVHSATATITPSHRAFGKPKQEEIISSNRCEEELNQDYRINVSELRMCVTVNLAISFRHWMVHTTVSVLAFIYFLRPMPTPMTAMRIQYVPVTQ